MIETTTEYNNMTIITETSSNVINNKTVLPVELIQYIKESRGKHKGQRRGVVIATKVGDVNPVICLGWSYTKTTVSSSSTPPYYKNGDVFDKQRGLEIARGRALVGASNNVEIPREVQPILERMEKRAHRYFRI